MLHAILLPLKRRFGKDKRLYAMLDSIFGLYPHNIELYKAALIHKSASVAMGNMVVNNERLEYLGDAVLQAVVSDHLFIEFQDRDEGFLTKLRSKMVNRVALNDLAIEIGLNRWVVSHKASTANKHIWGDAFEAMVGAIYLDKGYNFTNRMLINRIFRRYMDLERMIVEETDHKSPLIEWCQKSRRSIAFETGFSEHSTQKNPLFRSKVFIDSTEVGFGEGSSKKEAEQNAAYAVARMLTDEVGDILLDCIDKNDLDDK